MMNQKAPHLSQIKRTRRQVSDDRIHRRILRLARELILACQLHLDTDGDAWQLTIRKKVWNKVTPRSFWHIVADDALACLSTCRLLTLAEIIAAGNRCEHLTDPPSIYEVRGDISLKGGGKQALIELAAVTVASQLWCELKRDFVERGHQNG